jgi:hypothetical protein
MPLMCHQMTFSKDGDNTKWGKEGAERVSQALECMPSNCEVMSSNPSSTKNSEERLWSF